MTDKNLFKAVGIWMLALILGTTTLYGQQIRDIDEIQVVAPYEPSISDAFKININPVIPDTMTMAMDYNYRLRPLKLITHLRPGPLTPARMRTEPARQLSRGMVRGGYGSYQTPYFEGFYNSLQSDRYALGIRLKHRSSGEDIDDYPHSTYSQNLAKVYGTRFFDRTALNADVKFNRHMVHYYGRPSRGAAFPLPPDSLLPSADDLRQQYNFLSSQLGFGTHHTDSSRLGYRIKAGHNWLSDSYEGTEHHFSLDGSLGGETGADPFGIARKQYLAVDLSADYYHNTDPVDTTASALYTLKPTLHSYLDNLDFHIGVNMSVKGSDGNHQLTAYPLAGVEVNIIRNRLEAYMQLSGGMQRQSWRKLSSENPFVESAPVLKFSNTRHKIGGGFKGSFGDLFSYNFSVTDSRIDNYSMFTRQFFILGNEGDYPTANQQFAVLYDDIRKLQVSGELFTRFGQQFSLRLRGDYFDISTDNVPFIPHQPDLQLALDMEYNFRNKVIFTAGLTGRDETRGITRHYPDLSYSTWPYDETSYTQHTRKLQDFYIDAFLGVEYRYTRNLSVFLNLYNVQDESYERWMDYPTQGFSLLGGVSYAF
ncbi:MAG: hypothetical protein ACLFMU_00790 [Bacteroidales bacterium]